MRVTGAAGDTVRGCRSEAKMGPERTLEEKQDQFNAAMDRYERLLSYKAIYKAVSFLNVSLQLYLLYLVLPRTIGWPSQIIVLLCAYLAADFLNGLVHLYMDANDSYASLAGPLIAAFHLHHRTPVYRKSNILLVYFNESGAKNWLVGYLLLTVLLVRSGTVPPALAWGMVYFGILSSVAEVSHYCCHVTDSRAVRVLRALRLFLTKQHHGRHHIADNVNYAFLNGLTDPVLNGIARWLSKGYKTTTDRHYERYTGSGTANRAAGPVASNS
jgi:sterol desaturase/sphingolipid hydroxylase (fatty acid hydroxylase superfamily)